ncbi:hypothetical protein H7F36_17320 [Variovorax sp. PAMC28562]|uniref:hypothetical protein n=1 Tax=Variovorax sp. PAMC28562 TaxID=2762323 RepID=UPI00164D03AF|nr:hypothetical protein [Variovorax sp. PAMC28562]QNK72914.1 hypothetical protein H7F36_17320 [Variovorax sp. PAMC28562]
MTSALWLIPIALMIGGALLVASACSPSLDGSLLVVAILGALPWSLCLLMLDATPGFAETAGRLVALGIVLNLVGVWWGMLAFVKRRSTRRRAEVRLS